MLELLECLADISWHGEVDLSLFAIPIQCDPDVPCTCPVSGYFVMFLQCPLEVENMFFSYIFYPKIIHYKCELDRTPVVLP